MKALNNNAHPLESLLQQHCPNGVEFKELGELGEFSNTGVDKKKNEKEKEVILLNFIDVMKNHYIDEKIPTMIVTASDNKIKQCTCEKGDIFITPSSETIDEIGFASVITKTLSNTCYSYHIMRYRLFEKQITTSFFIRYLFESEIIRQQIRKYATGLTRFGLKKTKWEQIKIPLPPLEIQQKIVDILDAFTELQAELQAELHARRKQYEYYRNKLLSHDELENRTAKSRNDSDPTPLVPYVSLGEVCEKVFAGGDLPKEYSKDKKPSGEFLYPIYSNGSDENSLYGFSKTYRIDAEAVTISARGTIGFHTTREAKFTPIVRLITLIPNLNKITNRFLNYALYTTHIEKYGTSAGIPQLTIPMLEKITIPLPPLSVQEEIVELLDKFDTLANDLSAGLPAEIEARKKQYEYYRERLLSFIAKD
ncbi:restriction endonuclease subunit S [Campylobacter upsaliensis]|nr:restriction endonuclease subunit S [Campylobacter upsaliensis]